MGDATGDYGLTLDGYWGALCGQGDAEGWRSWSLLGLLRAATLGAGRA